MKDLTTPCIVCGSEIDIRNKPQVCDAICEGKMYQETIDFDSKREDYNAPLPSFDDVYLGNAPKYHHNLREDLIKENIERKKEKLRILGFNPDSMPEFRDK